MSQQELRDMQEHTNNLLGRLADREYYLRPIQEHLQRHSTVDLEYPAPRRSSRKPEAE